MSTCEHASEGLLSDGKKHGPSWLRGRCSNAVKGSAPGIIGTYEQQLVGKIKENLVSEIEAIVSKKIQEEVDKQVNKVVQENQARALKKLADTNPGIVINLEDFFPTSDDDNGTTVTRGGSS